MSLFFVICFVFIFVLMLLPNSSEKASKLYTMSSPPSFSSLFKMIFSLKTQWWQNWYLNITPYTSMFHKSTLETTATSASSAQSMKAVDTRSPLEHLVIGLCPEGSLEKEGERPYFRNYLGSWVCIWIHIKNFASVLKECHGCFSKFHCICS